MQKTVLKFGLIAGAVMSGMFVVTLPLLEKIGEVNGALIGYTTMVIAFLMVFFGVRAYRDDVGGGTISFKRAFSVGLLITLVASACYVATWEVVYFKFMPDFADKYAANAIAQVKKSGAPDAKVAEVTKAMNTWKENYKNPFFNMAETLMEPFPVGFLFTLIAAGVMSRKRRELATT